MEPVFLVRLLRANVMACRFSASVVAGFDLDVRSGASYHVCQRQFVRLEENSGDMVVRPWVSECALAELISGLIPACLVAVFFVSSALCLSFASRSGLWMTVQHLP